MKKYLFILIIFLITTGTLNLFADSAYFPFVNLEKKSFHILNCPYTTVFIDWDSWNWDINHFNHGGLLASAITFIAGISLYAGGGAAASTNLDMALLLITIGVPVNCAGCLLEDFFLQNIHNKYKAKSVAIKEDYVFWSWMLSSIGVALFTGSIAARFIEPGITGTIISISLGGTAMIVNVLDFFLVKQAWLKEINTGISIYGFQQGF
ncbi:MAG: hypothetical protein JXB88_06850 [Spirochaetales bacterium]|nr:hypothetical protein [Spirochaetales bacterium]